MAIPTWCNPPGSERTSADKHVPSFPPGHATGLLGHSRRARRLRRPAARRRPLPAGRSRPLAAPGGSATLLRARQQRAGGRDARRRGRRRLRAAGAAWARLRPMLFSGRTVGPRRKYRLFTTFVLSKLLHASELWCLSSEELTKLQRFHDRCLRAMVGLNRWNMHERHITDQRVREMLGAPPLRELLDRSCLRWEGHVARLSATRVPLQMMAAEVVEWPRHASASHVWGHRYAHRVTEALRNAGVQHRLFYDAAQDADRWSARIREGWHSAQSAAIRSTQAAAAAAAAAGEEEGAPPPSRHATRGSRQCTPACRSRTRCGSSAAERDAPRTMATRSPTIGARTAASSRGTMGGCAPTPSAGTPARCHHRRPSRALPMQRRFEHRCRRRTASRRTRTSGGAASGAAG
eukprot:gene9902-biopygen9288